LASIDHLLFIGCNRGVWRQNQIMIAMHILNQFLQIALIAFNGAAKLKPTSDGGHENWAVCG
jgi:hypothetical protein